MASACSPTSWPTRCSRAQPARAATTTATARSAGRSPSTRLLSREAASISVSGGASLTGVFFLTSASGETLVVKAVEGGGRAQLAAEVMKAVGVSGAGQRTVPLSSSEGRTLVATMKALATAQAQPGQDPATHPIMQKIGRQLEDGKFDAVAVMPKQSNLTNIDDLHAAANAQTIFTLMFKNGFFATLGRIHAADMMMGNGTASTA